ncbi:unnamed protein product, partial [Ectocarpus fasciculatus]
GAATARSGKEKRARTAVVQNAHHPPSTMDSFLSNVLAPKLEVGQEALFDALRARDTKRATRIIKRVSKESQARAAGRGGGGSTAGQRVAEADLNATDRRGLRPIH